MDLAITDDVYKYLKSDIMEGLNWVCGCESDCGRLGCNGGGQAFETLFEPCVVQLQKGRATHLQKV